MAPEYHFDYHTARTNRFAAQMDHSPLIVLLDEDVARVFTSSESVNKALRALIDAMPAKMKVKPNSTIRDRKG